MCHFWRYTRTGKFNPPIVQRARISTELFVVDVTCAATAATNIRISSVGQDIVPGIGDEGSLSEHVPQNRNSVTVAFAADHRLKKKLFSTLRSCPPQKLGGPRVCQGRQGRPPCGLPTGHTPTWPCRQGAAVHLSGAGGRLLSSCSQPECRYFFTLNRPGSSAFKRLWPAANRW